MFWDGFSTSRATASDASFSCSHVGCLGISEFLKYICCCLYQLKSEAAAFSVVSAIFHYLRALVCAVRSQTIGAGGSCIKVGDFYG